MTDDVRLYEWLLSRDFSVFAERCFETVNPGVKYRAGWHLQTTAEALRQVIDGETRRLILNMPPRSGKSLYASIALPAFLLGRDPRIRIMCVSSDDRLVGSLAASFKAVVGSDWYRRAFPAFRIQSGGDRATETITTDRGYRLGIPLRGSPIGRGANLIIADDVMSPDAALSEAIRRRECEMWSAKFPSRLDNKSRDAIIIVGQRLHEDDLFGRLTNPQEEP